MLLAANSRLMLNLVVCLQCVAVSCVICAVCLSLLAVGCLLFVVD